MKNCLPGLSTRLIPNSALRMGRTTVGDSIGSAVRQTMRIGGRGKAIMGGAGMVGVMAEYAHRRSTARRGLTTQNKGVYQY